MTVTINDKTTTLPQSWNELPLKDIAHCYAIIMQNTGSWLDPVELLPYKKLMLVKHLLKLSDAFIEQWEKECLEEYEEEGKLIFLAELDAVLKAANFLFEAPTEEGNTVSIALTFTRIPYSYLEHRKRAKGKRQRFYGPKNELSNLTIFELGYTFQLFEQFLQTQKEDLANRLIATLYRPPKPRTKANERAGYHNDIRQPLYRLEHLVEKRLKLVATLPQLTRQLILFWFASCRQQIINGYPNIFETENTATKRVGNDYGWGGLILSLADGIVNLDQVSERPYQDAFVYLSYLEDHRNQVLMSVRHSERITK